jgi:hypothetical protein
VERNQGRNLVTHPRIQHNSLIMLQNINPLKFSQFKTVRLWRLTLELIGILNTTDRVR